MKQLNFLIISLFLLSSCYKPVYTEYFSHENYTEFTTHEIPTLTNANGDANY